MNLNTTNSTETSLSIQTTQNFNESQESIIFEDDDLLVNKQVMSRNYVALQAGATTRIMDYIVQKQKIYVAQ